MTTEIGRSSAETGPVGPTSASISMILARQAEPAASARAAADSHPALPIRSARTSCRACNQSRTRVSSVGCASTCAVSRARRCRILVGTPVGAGSRLSSSARRPGQRLPNVPSNRAQWPCWTSRPIPNVQQRPRPAGARFSCEVGGRDRFVSDPASRLAIGLRARRRRARKWMRGHRRSTDLDVPAGPTRRCGRECRVASGVPRRFSGHGISYASVKRCR